MCTNITRRKIKHGTSLSCEHRVMSHEFLTLKPLHQRRKFLTILSYSHMFRRMYSLVPQNLDISAKTHYALYIEANSTDFWPTPLVLRNFHSDSFSRRIIALWNRLSGGYFPNHYKLKLVISRVNWCLSHIYE